MRTLLLAGALAWPSAAQDLALHPRALSEGLPAVARVDAFGLGAQAQRATAWLAGRTEAVLSGDVLVAGDARLPLSPALARALRGLQRFVALEDRARAEPVAFGDLRRALLSPDGVARLRSLFEDAMAASLRLSGRLVVPETGGEATLDGEAVAFHPLEDPLRPVLRELLARRSDPEALRRLFAERPEAARLDHRSILRRHLETRARWDAEGRVPIERRQEHLAMAVDTIAEEAVNTYTMSAKQELEATIGREWTGRYVGHWHLHPPDAGKAGWEDSVPPSEEDRARAEENGREVVVVFRRDGFDVYDLTRGGREDAFSYRSSEWRAHFQSIFGAL